MFGSHRVGISITKPDGTKYHTQVQFTEEFMLSMEHGHQYLADYCSEKLANAFNEAYDRHDFSTGKITSSESIPKDKIWEKVKNVNTDDELEEIRKLLRV